jgi:uncharacterized protein GlcG (DUF336 family)
MTRQVETLTLVEARLLVDVALAAGERIECPVSVAVLDCGRELLAFARQDDAPLLSAEIARSKAYTARSLNMATADLADYTRPDAPLFGLENSHPREVAIFGGGRPVEVGGTVVGAIGVSGGTVEQDDEIARAALAAFAEAD